MAVRRRRRKKKSLLKVLVYLVLSPFLIGFVAFLLWLFWPELQRVFQPERTGEIFQGASRRSEENISEQDRKELERILRRKQ